MSNFWYGVVEDRMDPLMLGRLRVRIFGIHSPLKVAAETEGSPTEGLLWCYPIQPIYSAAISGIGQSPTGIVEGSHVVGFFRDDFCQDGIILGTIGGIPQEEANPSLGFNDPNGVYPRYTNAPDTNILARGGVSPTLPAAGTGSPPPPTKEVPVNVENQDLNRDEAIAADKTPSEDIKPSPIPGMTIEDMLRYDEGVRIDLYWDSEGYPTIGIGHLIVREKTRNKAYINGLLSKQVGRTITNGRITNEECSKLFDGDLSGAIRDIQRNSTVAPVYASLDDTRKMAIINMTFQMGVGGVAKFTNTLAAMLRKDWQAAYNGMMNSLWARQTPNRANRVSKVILNGNLASYGVVGSGLVRTKDILFVEPASPYAAKYPYNHVYESESGHIIEIDDTPGASRYHRRHPSGTFEEIHPSGTRVQKIVGDDFLLVQQDHNVHVSGNVNLVCDSNTVINIVGNLDMTVQGAVTQLVRGDVTSQVDGQVVQTVNGNVTQLVKSNVDSTVDGDFTMKVAGNYSVEVGGSKVEAVSGDWTRSAANIQDTASGTLKSTGNGAYVELNSSVTISGSTINMN